MLTDLETAQLPAAIAFGGVDFVREGQTADYHWRGLTLRVLSGSPECWHCELHIRFAPAPWRAPWLGVTVATWRVHVYLAHPHRSFHGVADYFASAAKEMAVWEGIASAERKEEQK